jgi:integrase
MLRHAPVGKLDSLRPVDIERWQTGLQHLSASTRRSAFLALRAALKTARRDGLMTVDPMADLQTPSGAREKEPAHVNSADLEKLLSSAPEPWRTLFLTIAYTGLRRGEALALRWQDIDVERGQLAVVHGKTPRARRTVPLVPPVVQALRGLPRRDQERVFPYGGRHALKQFKRYSPRPELNIHSLRHGFCTRLMQEHVPVQVVSSLAGHSSPSVTLFFYAHSVSDLEREAVARLVDKS